MFGIRKWPVVPTLIVLVAAAVMVRLGFWQLDRMDEKELQIASYAQNGDLPVVKGLRVSDTASNAYRTVYIDCSSATRWSAVAGRNQNGQLGYAHRFTCSDAGDSTIFADIGWSQAPEQPAFTGDAVQGVLVPILPDYKVISTTGLAGLQPLATPNPANLPNNHFAYAVQWFLFALTALVIYVLALRRRQR